MPYIKQEERDTLNPAIEAVVNALDAFICDDDHDYYDAMKGRLNYIFSSILNEVYVKPGIKYTRINDVIGILECVKQEFYRRVAAPYEDQKIFDNGDAYCHEIEK